MYTYSMTENWMSALVPRQQAKMKLLLKSACTMCRRRHNKRGALPCMQVDASHLEFKHSLFNGNARVNPMQIV